MVWHKPEPILFLIGRVITHYYLEPMSNQQSGDYFWESVENLSVIVFAIVVFDCSKKTTLNPRFISKGGRVVLDHWTKAFVPQVGEVHQLF